MVTEATSRDPAPQPRRCGIADALRVVGERWSLLAVREISLGVHRFSQIAVNTGAPRDILTARLRTLEGLGVVERRQYSERPPRFEYRLTDAGRALMPVLHALRQWGDDWLNDEPPMRFDHSCGDVFYPQTHCRACGEPLRPGSLTVHRGH
ncbi:MAG: winged helix-turn-helix transcriptional regulator [Frankia sp.]